MLMEKGKRELLMATLSLEQFENYDVSKMTGEGELKNFIHSFYMAHRWNLNDMTWNLNKWDVSKVEDMSELFMDCENVLELILSEWETHHVKNMKRMFMNCNGLRKLNLRKFTFESLIEDGSEDIVKGVSEYVNLVMSDEMEREMRAYRVREMKVGETITFTFNIPDGDREGGDNPLAKFLGL